MIVSFYDKNLELITVISRWVSLLGINTYNTMGAFTLEMRSNSNLSRLMKDFFYCTIDNDDENPYIVMSAQSVDGSVVFTGFPCTYIFSKRASTTVIKNKNAEQAMKNLVDGMTPWDNLTTAPVQGLADNFNNQISRRQVLEYLQGIAQTTDMGFKVVKEGKNLVFKCFKPSVNNNIKYATSLRNAANLEYFKSENDYYNTAIVAGAGEGSKRVTVTAMLGNPTGTDRRELYVDARNEQPEEGETTDSYKQRLAQIGLQKLIEMLKVETLNFLVKPSDNVKLGDIINVSLDEFDISVQTRVVEEQLLNENNTTTRTISVGTPINIRRL
jgi:ribosomal 50S subunit-recycling heat shock protein